MLDPPLVGRLLGGARCRIGDGDNFPAGLLKACGVVLKHAACADDTYFSCHNGVSCKR